MCLVGTVRMIIGLFPRDSQEASRSAVAVCLLFLAAPGAFLVAADCWHFWLSYDWTAESSFWHMPVILGDGHVQVMWPCNYSCPYVTDCLSFIDKHLWLLSHGGVVPGCVLGEKLGFNLFLYLSVSEVAWFVVAQRRAVITHLNCTFPPLANIYLWDLTFLLPLKLSLSKWQRIVLCFPTLSWWNSSLFFFPQFSLWELILVNFVLCFFPLVLLQLYSIPICFCYWYLVSITHILHICSVLTVCNFDIA